MQYTRNVRAVISCRGAGPVKKKRFAISRVEEEEAHEMSLVAMGARVESHISEIM